MRLCETVSPPSWPAAYKKSEDLALTAWLAAIKNAMFVVKEVGGPFMGSARSSRPVLSAQASRNFLGSAEREKQQHETRIGAATGRKNRCGNDVKAFGIERP